MGKVKQHAQGLVPGARILIGLNNKNPVSDIRG